MEWNPIWSQVRVSSPILHLTGKKKRTVIFTVAVPQNGEKLRIRFSGEQSKYPVVIGSLRIWLNGKSTPVTVQGASSFTIPARESLVSDEIPVSVKVGDQLEVRIYYLSKPAESNAIEEKAISFSGDQTAMAVLPEYKEPDYKAKYGIYDFISSISKIEVYSESPVYRIIAFGDSITAMSRWTKPLQKRLQDSYGGKYVLLNAGISGNCLLYEKKGMMGALYGQKGVDRFQRDVMQEENLHCVILALGVNDISYLNAKTKKNINQKSYQEAVKDLVAQLRNQNVRVVGHTMTPRKGYTFGKKYTQEAEGLRQEINAWLRSCNLFDLLVDTDAILRDPNAADVILEGLHQGDHLHPNEAGGQKIADGYDLQKLTGENDG
ncbi:MAG: GDSL-type esterase/lipase family protein [Lachnospiraceae bacterium]|nr:GDSL-type esterase/lipase family protein [Lachnospiraceae bacterium]